MVVELRPCVSIADCLALNDFLREAAGLWPALYTWEPRRWEGLLFHRNDADLVATRSRVAQEVKLAFREGQIVGAITPEYPGGGFIQAAPTDEATQTALIDVAIETLQQPLADGKGTWLEIWCRDADKLREDLLRARGFMPTSEHQFVRTRDLSQPVASVSLPAGYTVTGMTDSEADYEGMAVLLNEAFGRSIHSASEYRNFANLAPSYEAELQVVVRAPDGSFAAHAGFTMHRQESFGVVEPVCTHPAHQNLGLARAAMAEGMRRMQDAGIATGYIGAWYSNPVSNHVYASMGFENPVADRIWRREQVA